MQLPIKDNVVFKFADFKSTPNAQSDTQRLLNSVKDCNAINDQNNPIIAQVAI
jgi:hypothetical protein